MPNNNGRVGLYGISYPGFYAAAGMIDAHPALKAVVAAGADRRLVLRRLPPSRRVLPAARLQLPARRSAGLGRSRPPERTSGFDHGTPDGYEFFLDVGRLEERRRTATSRASVAFWNEMRRPSQLRRVLAGAQPAAASEEASPRRCMTVGGWFDAEDLYGPLQHLPGHREAEPRHLQHARDGPVGPRRLGAAGAANASAASSSAARPPSSIQQEIELPVLRTTSSRTGPAPKLPRPNMFETGANHWRTFDGLAAADAPERDAVDWRADEGSSSNEAPERHGARPARRVRSATPPSRCRSPKRSPSA